VAVAEEEALYNSNGVGGIMVIDFTVFIFAIPVGMLTAARDSILHVHNIPETFRWYSRDIRSAPCIDRDVKVHG